MVAWTRRALEVNLAVLAIGEGTFRLVRCVHWMLNRLLAQSDNVFEVVCLSVIALIGAAWSTTGLP